MCLKKYIYTRLYPRRVGLPGRVTLRVTLPDEGKAFSSFLHIHRIRTDFIQIAIPEEGYPAWLGGGGYMVGLPYLRG